MSEQNVAAVERLLNEAWGQGDLSLFDELVADDFIDHNPVMGDGDAADVKDRIAEYRAAFPDLTFTIQDIFAAGDKVVARWSAVGTFQNEFMGQPPTHEKGEPVSGISIDRFEGGLLVESWGQWDALRFMRNLGALPEQAAPSAG